MKVKFCDSFVPSIADITMNILKSEFGKVEISDNPDYVFFSIGGGEHLKYDCPRIFYTGENCIPDFNCCDYAIAFSHLSFGDRYLRFPLYKFYFSDYQKALTKHKDYNIEKKTEFCNFVYSNGRDAMPERDEFFHLLSQYKRVDSGGKHLNNIGNSVENKYEFQKKYKFSIAFENACNEGYVTEKILQAFSAGTIPIYYGDPSIGNEFNTKAFINCHDFDSFDRVIERIKEIDQDDSLCEEYLSQPIFYDMNNREDSLKEYREFIVNICKNDPIKAKRRCDTCWGKSLQEDKKNYYRINKFLNNRTFISKVIKKIIRY